MYANMLLLLPNIVIPSKKWKKKKKTIRLSDDVWRTHKVSSNNHLKIIFLLWLLNMATSIVLWRKEKVIKYASLSSRFLSIKISHVFIKKKKCNVHWSYCCPQSRHSPFSLNLKTVASITWQCLPLSVYDSMALSSNV